MQYRQNHRLYPAHGTPHSYDLPSEPILSNELSDKRHGLHLSGRPEMDVTYDLMRSDSVLK